jgi:hypothetical protein
MSIQTNFRAEDMLGGAKPVVADVKPAAKVAAPKKAAAPKAEVVVEATPEPVVEVEAVVVEAEPEAVKE